MKFSTIAAAAAAMLLGGVANATCLSCDYEPQTIGLGGSVATIGVGISEFNGLGGSSSAVKDGGSGIEISLDYGSNLCGTPNCDTVGGTLDAYFYESVGLSGLAYGNKSSKPSSIQQESGTAGVMMADLLNRNIMVGINAGGAGSGKALFTGDEGFTKVMGNGYNNISGNLSAEGLCPTCKDGYVNMVANVGQFVGAWGEAYSQTPGTAAMVRNETATTVEINLDFGN